MSESLLLLAILALLVAVPWLLRRHRAASPDAVRVVARTALYKNAVVAVVVVGERRLLVGAGERGVELLAELDGDELQHDGVRPHARNDRAAMSAVTIDQDALGRRDAVGAEALRRSEPATALDALAGLELSEPHATAGPGIGLVDRLRAMTVRTPVTGRPLHVPLRR